MALSANGQIKMLIISGNSMISGNLRTCKACMEPRKSMVTSGHYISSDSSIFYRLQTICTANRSLLPGCAEIHFDTVFFNHIGKTAVGTFNSCLGAVQNAFAYCTDVADALRSLYVIAVIVTGVEEVDIVFADEAFHSGAGGGLGAEVGEYQKVDVAQTRIIRVLYKLNDNICFCMFSKRKLFGSRRKL